jgi:DNA-binding CsgD family transcriptional regulator
MLTQLPPRTHAAAAANMAAKWGTSVQLEQHVLFQTVIESLTDGVLILTKGGAQVYANHGARQLCAQLNASKAQPHGIPKAIEQVCQTLVRSRSTTRHQAVIVEAEIRAREASRLWVQAAWLEQPGSEPYVLVMLKDCQQALQNLASTEAAHYQLTPREAQIWLLRRIGSTYQEIAKQLYVSRETVKKHLQSIYGKQRCWSLDE